ncbi:Uncharacterised protein [Mycoplasmopsis californica]|uniref:Transmembrane protein n=1 Tax=Mycoplasmopsis equigenitalium TaxID=114883 RepID=A0ABY5J2T2_9BACT|nr:hypothetical protein [Mycoplasmopsis equigenitalium]UUD36836.1 hypothetical protein NPA09_02975 [Mycoplasmopsis equigenitalium]VEU69868.1 Uncharacterised protein [Mycoplasmopsis californica]
MSQTQKTKYLVLLFLLIIIGCAIILYFVLNFKVQKTLEVKLQAQDQELFTYITKEQREHIHLTNKLFIKNNGYMSELKIKEIIYEEEQFKIIFDIKIDNIIKNNFLDKRAFFILKQQKILDILIAT